MLPHACSRRWILSALLAGAALPAAAEAPARSLRPLPRPPAQAARPPQPAPGLGSLVEAARLGGRTGVVVMEAASGRVLEGLEAGTPLPPASVAKAMTALFALERLGPGHRWATRLVATGGVAGGQVQGDLILQGGGDPTLTTDQLGDLAARLRAAGVRGVRGRFLVHSGALPRIDRIDPAQPDHVGYNPTLGGLNLNFNRVHFEWKRGAKGWLTTMDARGERFVPKVAMARMRIAERQAPLFTYESQGDGDSWTVASAALGKGGARWLPVRHPELYAGEVFQTLAAAQGIGLPAPRVAAQMPAGQVIASVQSDSLMPVMRDMLRYSVNLTAEVVGLSASGAPTLAASGGRMSEWLQGRYGTGCRFVDHSGLGGLSRISAADMAQALQRGRGSGLVGILRDQGMRDAKGQPVKNSPVKVPSKTGTLNFVSGLAGYIQPPSGRELVFAIFSADAARRDALGRAEMERPRGGPEWTARARLLQGQLVGRWAQMFG